MAVRASASAALTSVRDGARGETGATGTSVTSVTTWWRLADSKPAAPTGAADPSGWSQSEPRPADGYSGSLWRCERVLYSTGAASWGPVTEDSAYWASSRAYAKGAEALTQAASVKSATDELSATLKSKYTTSDALAETYATKAQLTATSESITTSVSGSLGTVSDRVTTLETSATQTAEAITDTISRMDSLAEASDELSGRVADVEASFVRAADADGNPTLTLMTTANALSAVLTNSRLEFRDSGVAVAYVGGQRLYISAAEVTGSLAMGGFAWQARDNGHLSLVATT